MDNLLNSLISKIGSQITLSTKREMDESEISYIAGLADAIEIIEHEKEDMYFVGHDYYVLVYNEEIMDTVIRKMRLYRINHTENKTTYSFILKGFPIINLYSRAGLKNRVYYTYEDAKRGKDHVYLDQSKQY